MEMVALVFLTLFLALLFSMQEEEVVVGLLQTHRQEVVEMVAVGVVERLVP
jgi:hypothetical protein